MNKEEQKQIAFNQGRLAAWLGTSHNPSGLGFSRELQEQWQLGVMAQCVVMREETAKIPLVFKEF